MIEFNLLPEVKLEYIKTRRLKRLVILGSFAAAAVSLVIFIGLLIVVDGFQKKHLSDLNKDITTSKNQIAAIPDFNQILTIQTQLASLPALDAQKPVTSRLFGYLQQLIPLDVTLDRTSMDFNAHSIDIAGNASSLASVNQLVDTLKFTTYDKSATDTSNLPAFSQVVLTSFSLSNNTASYEVQADYDPAIFNVADNVKLTVPSITSTRSITDQPTDLFKQSTTTTTNTGTGQ